MDHHAYVFGGENEEGITAVRAFVKKEFGMEMVGNPDVVVLKYGLLTVADARRIGEIAMQGPIAGDKKVIVISASRLYHEAQNALLKLFEEPPRGTHLFLILPTLGGLLPTLRSRVAVLETLRPGSGSPEIAPEAERFLAMSKEKRSAYIKKLANGKDEEERRENRDEALAIVNGIEATLHSKATPWGIGVKASPYAEVLSDIATLRAYLHERSAPVRMILEHISLTLPRDLKPRA